MKFEGQQIVEDLWPAWNEQNSASDSNLYLICCLKAQLCSQAVILARKKRINQFFKDDRIFIARRNFRTELLIKTIFLRNDIRPVKFFIM